ncbi:MAG: IS3 family transposase [Tissierellia bacterium]|nr:IS3 family transposase [Tissierellia bacterium]
MEEEPYAKPRWAKALGVSTSGYYSWLQERDSRINRKDELRPFVIQVFKEGRGVYGAERICGILRSRGIRASFTVVSNVMKEEKLASRHMRRKQRSLTDSSAARDDSYKNLVRGLEITERFQGEFVIISDEMVR